MTSNTEPSAAAATEGASQRSGRNAMTSKASDTSSLKPAAVPTKADPYPTDDSPEAAALRRKFLRKAVEEYEAEFGAFTEEELAQARSETAK